MAERCLTNGQDIEAEEELHSWRKKYVKTRNDFGSKKEFVGAYEKVNTHRPEKAPQDASKCRKLSKAIIEHGNVRPQVNVTLGGGLESLINHVDREPGAYASTSSASAGTYKNRCSMGWQATAGVLEAGAHAGIAQASANGPRASVGVHTGAGTWAAANATLEVCRAEANLGFVGASVGLNANTGASIGVDGVQASVLGFGFTIGPRVSIETPIGSLSCSVM